jgi:hypothetical protein
MKGQEDRRPQGRNAYAAQAASGFAIGLALPSVRPLTQ